MARLITGKDTIDVESETYFQFYDDSNIYYEPHIHDYYEIVLVISGQLPYTLCGKDYMLQDGNLVFVRPNDVHHKHASASVCKHVHLGFPVKTVDELFDFVYDDSIKHNLLSMKHLPILKLTYTECELMYAKIKQLYYLPYSRKKLIRSQLRVLLVETINQYLLENVIRPISTTDNPSIALWFKEMLFEMAKSENFSLSLVEWADRFHVSKTHVSRSFKNYLNTTFSKHLNSLKINCAANLLAYTDLDIISISLECGFNNLSHFYHLFRNNFGMTPQQFRNSAVNAIYPKQA